MSAEGESPAVGGKGLAHDVGLVLAAGAGSRMGTPKAPLLLDGVRLVDRAVSTLLAGGCAEVVVISGAWHGYVPGAVVVRNEQWALGIGTSLRCGLAAASARDARRAVIIPVDQPLLTPATVRRVRHLAGGLGRAVYHGRPGHPVVVARLHWAGVAQADGIGARAYLDRHPTTVEVPIESVEEAVDVDTPEQLASAAVERC